MEDTFTVAGREFKKVETRLRFDQANERANGFRFSAKDRDAIARRNDAQRDKWDVGIPVEEDSDDYFSWLTSR